MFLTIGSMNVAMASPGNRGYELVTMTTVWRAARSITTVSGRKSIARCRMLGRIRAPMAVQRIVVCEAQVPFVRGGAEYLVRSLVGELQQRGYEAELVSMPFK